MPESPRHARIAARQRAILEELLARAVGEAADRTPADALLRREFQLHREFGSRDRRFLSNAVFSFFRWKGWLDLAPQLPLLRRAAAAYRLDFPESHPALDGEAVVSPPDPALPAATLVEKAGQLAAWLELAAPPDPEQLLPAAILPLLASPGAAADPSARARLVEHFQQRPPVWIRARAGREEPLRTTGAALGMTFAPHPRLPLAWAVPPRQERLRDLAARLPGAYEIQDVASQAVAATAAPGPGESWWDVCAGAGGKSLHLADLAGGRLSILATDSRASALHQADRRARLSTNPRAFRFLTLDAVQSPPPGAPFDGVLLDAPCSGTGTWARNADARWRFNPHTFEETLALQAALLRQAARAVRPGGTLVYATCSLTTPENTGQLAAFLAENPDFATDPCDHPLTGERTGGAFFIWPWQGPGDGFFIARLRRRSA